VSGLRDVTRVLGIGYRGQEVTAQHLKTSDISTPEPAKAVVFGRFMLPDMSEHACQVFDMTLDGATFMTSDVPPTGLAIVAYLEDLGRVEVVSGDQVPGGFKITYAATGSRLERLHNRITYLLDRAAGAPDHRHHPRFEPKDKHSAITLPDGRNYACEVIDISVSGAAIKTEIMPAMGTYLMVGKMRGRVVRYLENGFAVHFVKQLSSVQVN
jgi:PilZ domain